MSLRLRLTLIYITLLGVVLSVIGLFVYWSEEWASINLFKQDLQTKGEIFSQHIWFKLQHPDAPEPALPLDFFPGAVPSSPPYNRLIACLLNERAELIPTPYFNSEAGLPLSAAGLEALQAGQVWWETASWQGEQLFIHSRPVFFHDRLVNIVQVAHPLSHRENFLNTLRNIMLVASLLALLIFLVAGWGLSGIALRPVRRITQTAQLIGRDADLTQRVNYTGPADEVGELAATFNAMLGRVQESQQRLSRALQQQREFVANVSHELRTPLSTLRCNLALLRRQPPPPAVEQQQIIREMDEENERLVRLVNDLLALARADAGLNLALEPVPLGLLAAEVCRLAQRMDSAREIRAEIQEATALANRDALKQVLLILLENALKYSTGRVGITAERAGEQVLIIVQDEGPGIASEALPHIFDRFYRERHRPDVPGAGLGLAIAKALVESQSGSIAVRSEPGWGTAVTVCLEGVFS